MQRSPDFTAPRLFDDPDAALDQVRRIYQHSVDFLRKALHEYVDGADFHGVRVRACYPYVRLHTHSNLRLGEGAEACTRVALKPVTGRAHQLRVHLLALGHPIVGDPLYAPPDCAARFRDDKR